MKLSDLTN